MTDTGTSIEALAREVAEYLRAHRDTRPLLNEAGQLVAPGAQAAGRLVVNPGDEIQSVWGNTTYDQTMQVFLGAGDRDNQWSAPHDGALCFQVDTMSAWVRRAGAWCPLSAGYTARVHRAANFSCSATPATPVLLTWDTKGYDPQACYSTSTGLYTCPVAGLYDIRWNVGLSIASGYYAMTTLRQNGTAVAYTTQGYANVQSDFHGTDIRSCAAGDTLAVWVQSSMASTALRTGPTESFFIVSYRGPVI